MDNDSHGAMENGERLIILYINMFPDTTLYHTTGALYHDA